MARTAKPWYWSDRDAWYVWYHGKQVSLRVKGKANRKEAWLAYCKLVAGGDTRKPLPGKGLNVKKLVEVFLAEISRKAAPVTVAGYRQYLEPFAGKHGTCNAEEIQPRHVTDWLSRFEWGPTTRRNAITAIKRCWSWAEREKRIRINQLKNLERPRPETRDVIPKPEDITTALNAIEDGPFRLFVEFLFETGCRPGEASRIEARHVNLKSGTVTIHGKTTRATGRMRVIYLSRRASEIVGELARLHPNGVIFRNARGKPWNRSAWNSRIIKLRKKTGLGNTLVLYAFRHHWITDALEKGVSPKIVAELAGHTSTAMLDRHYSHLIDRQDALRRELNKIRS